MTVLHLNGTNVKLTDSIKARAKTVVSTMEQRYAPMVLDMSFTVSSAKEFAVALKYKDSCIEQTFKQSGRDLYEAMGKLGDCLRITVAEAHKRKQKSKKRSSPIARVAEPTDQLDVEAEEDYTSQL